LFKRLLKRLCQAKQSDNFGKPGKARGETWFAKHADIQNEAGVARGKQNFSECKKAAPHERVRQKINKLVCHETAHDAPVNTLTKIGAIRRAHGVRVNQRSFQFTRLSATRKTLLEKRIFTF
jgi:hypothetical protein